MKKIVVIASLSHPEYNEKIKRNKKITKPFWDCALLKNGQPVDFVDFYKTKRKTTSIRHIYNNGIVLYNFFRNKKCDVHLINTFDDLSKEDTKKISQCDYVIFSTNYPGFGDRLKNIIDTVKKIRELNPKTKIIIGGWEIYLILKEKDNPDYQSFLKKLHKAGADLVIGSRKGLEIIWESIKKSPDFKGIIYDDQDYPPVNPKLYSISSLPKKFHSSHTAITTTDGCYFSCNFCSYKLLHNKVEQLSIKNTKQILINLHQGRFQSLRHIRFADECFNYPTSRILEICQMISSLKFKFNWSCFIRVGNISREIVQAMKKAGCSFVSVGLENGDYKMRLRMNKIITDQEILKTIKLFKQAGIKVATSLIIGYYGENEKTIQATKGLLEKANPDIARINIWYPIRHESKTVNALKFSLEWTEDGWSHSTMNEKQAYESAAWLYKNTKDVVFSPPFTSIFDLLPWLQGEGLNKQESFEMVKEYYLKSLK